MYQRICYCLNCPNSQGHREFKPELLSGYKNVKAFYTIYSYSFFFFSNKNVHESVKDIEIPREVTFCERIHVLLGNKE